MSASGIRPRAEKRRSAIRTYGNTVYVAADGMGALKIGFTKNLRKRLYDLSRERGTSIRLVLAVQCGVDAIGDPRAYCVEQQAHRLLAPNRLKGEWYRVSEMEAMEAVVAGAIFAQTTLTPLDVVLQ